MGVFKRFNTEIIRSTCLKELVILLPVVTQIEFEKRRNYSN